MATRVRALTGSAEAEPEPEVQAPLLKVFGAEPSEPAEPRLVAQVDGFNLHAATHFEAHERVALERFCRYALRGPLAQARLSSRPDGKLVYRLKEPKPDGTTHIVFTAQALLQRLRWILPLPRHQTRYHGVLADARLWQSRVKEHLGALLGSGARRDRAAGIFSRPGEDPVRHPLPVGSQLGAPANRRGPSLLTGLKSGLTARSSPESF